MAYPQVGQPGGPFSPRRRRTGLIAAIVVLVVLILVGLGAWKFASGDDDPAPVASKAPTPVPTLSPDPPLLAMFQDADLREFARRAAGKATGCEAITASLEPGSHPTEAVKCTFAGGYRAYFFRYDTLANRDNYARSARKGFSGGNVVVDNDTFWTNDAGAKQGAYITGYARTGSTRFAYWDVTGKPLSGEIYGTSRDASATEAFWRSIR
jgi:hypothetical protein